ncbi:hypothetical protein JCM10213_008062 [Rhodosporidiobolus nylandii]
MPSLRTPTASLLPALSLREVVAAAPEITAFALWGTREYDHAVERADEQESCFQAAVPAMGDDEADNEADDGGLCMHSAEIQPDEVDDEEELDYAGAGESRVEDVDMAAEDEDAGPLADEGASTVSTPDAASYCAWHPDTIAVARVICRDHLILSEQKLCSDQIRDVFLRYDDATLCALLARRTTSAGARLYAHFATSRSGAYLPPPADIPQPALPHVGRLWGVYHVSYGQAPYSGLALSRQGRGFNSAERPGIKRVLLGCGYAEQEVDALLEGSAVRGLGTCLIGYHANPTCAQTTPCCKNILILKHHLKPVHLYHLYSPVLGDGSIKKLSDTEAGLTGLAEHLTIVASCSLWNGEYGAHRRRLLRSQPELQSQPIQLNAETGLEPRTFQPAAMLYLTVGRFRTTNYKRIGGRLAFAGGNKYVGQLLYDATIRFPLALSKALPEMPKHSLNHRVKVFISFSQDAASKFYEDVVEANQGHNPWLEFKPVLPVEEAGSYVIVIVLACPDDAEAQKGWSLVASSLHYEGEEAEASGGLSRAEATRWRAWLFYQYFSTSQELARGDGEAVRTHARVLMEGDGEAEEEVEDSDEASDDAPTG